MKTHEPYVKLLGSMDFRREAWKTSRPKFSEENLNFDKVAEMDLSLNSMLTYTFEMRSSVIMRDLIFSLRPLEGWALSTRSMPINLDTVRLSAEYENNVADYARIETMFKRLDAGESRDAVRDILPLTVSSTYTFTMDFRVLMSFCKTIESLDEKLFRVYCIPMLGETDNFEAYRSTTVQEALDYYRIHESEMIDGINTRGEMVIGHYRMKAALASQFLRQHYSKIKIGLWNLLDEDKLHSENLNQASLVDVAFYIDKTSYHRLMAMRAHWVIDWSADMWGTIVGDYVTNMSTEEFWNFIPNGGGKTDPYWADVYNRVLREDPGVPCPIMCEWPAMIDEKFKEVGPSLLMDKYQALVTEGYIKDNPENEHRKLYLSLGDSE